MSIMAKTPSGYKKIGSAYLGERPVDKVYNANGDVVYALQRELTGVPPLLFKGKEQSELLNYRIYGDTVDGNSVGDLVESGEHAGEYKVPVTVEGKNLFNNIWEQGNIRADNGQKEASNIMICSDYFPVEYDKTYSISRTISEGYNNVRGYDASKNYIGSGTTVCSVANPFVNADTKKGIFKITNSLVAFVRFNHYSNNLNMQYMIVEGDYTNTPMPPYEPYHEPVITSLYLPEPIKMVGDEAEYIDYAEQKQHRVRKNLLPNETTNRTINGVTFTVNNDGSVTCNGTATDLTFFSILMTINQGSYIVSGAPAGSNLKTPYVTIRLRTPSGNTDNPPFNNNDFGVGVSISSDKNNNNDYFYKIRVPKDYTCDNLTFHPMIRKADIEDDTYEPYIENTDVDVTLPVLPVLPGTNTLSIDATVQPSRMDIKGRIKTLT